LSKPKGSLAHKTFLNFFAPQNAKSAKSVKKSSKNYLLHPGIIITFSLTHF
jgi:hypothetical protein